MSLIRSNSVFRKRWNSFKAQRRAVLAGVFVLSITLLSFTAEIWSNSRPLVLHLEGKTYFPVFQNIHPTEFGITDQLTVDYRELEATRASWAIWPLNRWDPYESNKSAEAYPAPPSKENWLGTDDRGRDILARLLYGLRYSLVYALSVWAICSILAVFYGGMSGYFGGWFDLLGQRAVEVLSTVPQLLLLIYLISVFEPSLLLLVVVSCVFGWIGLSAYVRGEVLKARKQDYTEAARAAGASHFRIVFRHLLPNSLTPLITFAPFSIVGGIGGLAVLDYLGFGLPAPTPSWGELLQQAQQYFGFAWWLAFFPSFALFISLFSFTLLGEGLRTAFDPNAVSLPVAASKRASKRWLENWKDRFRNVRKIPSAKPLPQSRPQEKRAA